MTEATLLPPADWQRRDGMDALIAALGGGEQVRFVGGAVRDTLLGIPVADVDCATTLLPDEVIRRCAAAGLRTVPTGIEHGTVTAVLPGGPVEVTTLRRDVSTDGRRATVAFSDRWQDDAARRDFTINALYADPATGKLFDYHGGLADLAARRVRFIGDPAERIREDHLRILRFFRFQARFGDTPDQAGLVACAELADTLKGLSRERVAAELLGILGLPDPTPTVQLMHDIGVLPVILPEVEPSGLAELARVVRVEGAAGAHPNPVRRLAALLPPSPAVAENVAARLRLSRAQRNRLSLAAGREASDAGAQPALAYRIGTEAARDRLLLLGLVPDLPDNWAPPAFPVKGRDVLALGVPPGPPVARVLKEAEARWIAEGFPGPERAHALLAEAARHGQP